MQPIRANILCRGLGQVEGDPVVTAVVTDNRAAGPGSLFVCIRGARADGHDYAAKAVQAGACAVVAQHPVQPRCQLLCACGRIVHAADHRVFEGDAPSRCLGIGAAGGQKLVYPP